MKKKHKPKEYHETIPVPEKVQDMSCQVCRNPMPDGTRSCDYWGYYCEHWKGYMPATNLNN